MISIFRAISWLFVFLITASSQAPAPFPPLGRLIDLGGYRVHLFCSGQGTPAVLIVGAGFSFDWDLVQSEVAQFTRVCSYDPSGTAWSDPGPGPDCPGRVSEIHRLLRAAHEQGPFILVGLSIGALVARRYAAEYADEAAGVVLIDHTFLESTGKSPSQASPDFDIPPALISQTPIRIEAEEDLGKLPPRDQELHRWAVSLNPIRPTIETARTCLAAAGRSLGRLPLALVSTGNRNPAYLELQQELLSLSGRSRQFVAGASGHSVELDQPDVIVRAIRSLLEQH